MVSNGGCSSGHRLLANIRECIIDKKYEEARVMLFKLNNSTLGIEEKCYTLYTLSYVYMKLKDIESAKYYIKEAIIFVDRYKDSHRDKYNKIANSTLSILHEDLTTDDKIAIYKNLYEINDEDEEFKFNALVKIYELENSIKDLFEAFKICLKKGYIGICRSIITSDKISAELKEEMVYMYNKKIDKVS